MSDISDIVNCDDLDSYIKFAPKILGDGTEDDCNAVKDALEGGGVCTQEELDKVHCGDVMAERKSLLENGDCKACCEAARLITDGVDRQSDSKTKAKKQIMSNYCNHLAGGTCKTGSADGCNDPTPQPLRERVQDFKSCVNDDDGNCKVDKNSNLIMVLFLLVLVALILGVVSIVKK